jgi:hypothetical protein
LAPTSALPLLRFHFSLGIFFFSNKRKEKKTQRKKNHREEKICGEGKNLPSSSHSTLSLLAHVSTLPLLHFRFKRFFLASSSSQTKEKKKKKKKKKTIEEKKM